MDDVAGGDRPVAMQSDITIRRQSRTLQVQQGSQFLLFDTTGRLLLTSELGRVVRRGLNHRMLEVKVHRETDGQIWRSYRDLTEQDKEAQLEVINAVIRQAYKTSAGADRDWLERVLQWSGPALALDETAFRKVYKPVSILPPDQYHSVVVQVAEGCSYNQCLFCDFYRDRPFHIKSLPELTEHLQGIRNFFGERLQDRSNVFLGDGNALVIPTTRLLTMMDLIQQNLNPMSDTMAAFMDTFSLERKSTEELREIHRRGLDVVYVGLESGADEVRNLLKKQGTASDAVEEVSKLKETGYRVGVILLVGVGGKEMRPIHVRETDRVLAQLPLTPADIVYLSPFVLPKNPAYIQQMHEMGMTPYSPEEVQQEWMGWQRRISSLVTAKVTLYSISEHIY